MNKSSLLTVEVEKLALLGRGIAHVDGKTVFIRGALPGDRAQIRLTKAKSNYAEADLIAIDQPSPSRVLPRCSHFGFCGGCDLQHLSYPAQVQWKKIHLAETLEHLGRLRQLPEIGVVSMNDPWHYRNKMEFSFGQEGEHIVVGLHQKASFQRVIKIDHCWIAPELASTILQEVESAANASGLPAYHPKRQQGFWRYMVVRVARASNRASVLVVTHEGPRHILETMAKQLVQRVPEVSSVMWGISTRVSDVSNPEKVETLIGSDILEDTVGPLTLQMKPMNFLQPNLVQAQALYKQLSEQIGLRGQEVVYDLYCGVGTIGLMLAPQAKTVYGIESDPENVALAFVNAKRNRLDNAIFVCGKVEELLTKRGLLRLGPRPDVIVVDPPRAGIHPDAIAPLLESKPRRLFYISCNPASLARDLQVILEREPEYQLKKLTLFDFFPHTAHMETFAVLER